jgi:ADP-ribose pyrophosphatase YjhB (NUDIX family)/predicted RNase H-like HicB family nuclease
MMFRVITFPFTVEQDEDGAWCAAAYPRPGVGAFGDGDTREAAVADLRTGLESLLDEVGIPDMMPVAPRPAIRPGGRRSATGTQARRIDYHDDPVAPEPNSLIPSVNVIVTNGTGEILLIRRSDNGNWAFPGGAIDLGESVTQAGIRETREESGIECEITGLVGIYSDPKHIILYTSNGEARQEFSIVLTARPVRGEPTPSSETAEVRWVPVSSVADLTMDRSMHVRLRDYLAGRSSPVLA